MPRTARPRASTATHSLVDGQEIPLTWALSTRFRFHIGFVGVRATRASLGPAPFGFGPRAGWARRTGAPRGTRSRFRSARPGDETPQPVARSVLRDRGRGRRHQVAGEVVRDAQRSGWASDAARRNDESIPGLNSRHARLPPRGFLETNRSVSYAPITQRRTEGRSDRKRPGLVGHRLQRPRVGAPSGIHGCEHVRGEEADRVKCHAQVCGRARDPEHRVAGVDLSSPPERCGSRWVEFGTPPSDRPPRRRGRARGRRKATLACRRGDVLRSLDPAAVMRGRGGAQHGAAVVDGDAQLRARARDPVERDAPVRLDRLRAGAASRTPASAVEGVAVPARL